MRTSFHSLKHEPRSSTIRKGGPNCRAKRLQPGGDGVTVGSQTTAREAKQAEGQAESGLRDPVETETGNEVEEAGAGCAMRLI